MNRVIRFTSSLAAKVCACMALAAICPAFGKSFSLDLRKPVQKGAAVRRLAATPRTDGEVRSANLDAGVADVGEVAVGDELAFTLFDDVTLTLTLKEKMPAPLGGDAFLAEVTGYEGIRTAVVLRTEDGLTVNVQDFRNNRLYKVTSTPTGVTVSEIEPVRGGTCGNDALTPLRVGEPSVGESQSVRFAASGAKLLSAAEQSDTCVDILVAYDGNAQSWARQNGGGITNFAQVAVQRMNAALANTGLDASFRFRLVGVTTVSVTAGDVHTALYAIDDDDAGWADIKTARETCGADIVTTLIDTGSAYGTTGVGWSLASKSSLDAFAPSAYNVCAVRSVAQSDTMAHECGHNMGAGHSDVQTSSPGPQLYDYSAGYFFTAGGTAYSTIMSYAQENPSGASTTAIPYFSSPNYTYNGAAVGNATHDNTRTLAGTYPHVVNWRAQKVPMSYDVIFEPASGELFNGSLSVTLTSCRAGAEIRYTLDGSTPTASSPRYTGPITLRGTATIKAATVVNGVCSLPYTASYYSDDDLGYALGLPDYDWTATGDWRVQTTNALDGVGVETPGAERNAVATLSTRIIGPESLAFSLRQRGYYEVTVLCDGTPIWSCGSTWNSSWREESVDIPEGAHDVTISVKTTYGYAGCFFGLDDLRVYPVRKPVFTPQTGFDSETAFTFTGEQMIEITAPDEGATIYYTLDGSSPTGEDAILYEGPFFITESTKVNAVAMVPGRGESPLAEGWFVERHTPVVGEWTLWGEGAYEAVQQDGRLIAELCWDLLGCGWSQALESIATDPLFTTWAAANGVYLFTPAWRDKTGTGLRFWSLYSQTALYEELNHYTYYPTFVLAKPDNLTTCVGTILARNDGDHGASGIKYNGTANSLIACFASFFGTSPLAAPVASVTDAAGRSFPFNVTLANPNGSGTIYYTLDGTAPTRTNGTRYTGAITIPASGTTLKAVVWPDGADAVSGIPLVVTYENLSDAIAIDGVTWQNDAAHPWTVSRTAKGVTLSGGRDDTLASGSSATSTLTATLDGLGRFSFKYYIYKWYTTLELQINGVQVAKWTSDVTPAQTYEFDVEGPTEIKWIYTYPASEIQWSDWSRTEISDITWAPYAAPSAPSGLTASDSEYTYGTLLRWDTVSGAASYDVYRSAANSPAAAEKIGSTQKDMYWDTGAEPGRTYWYWIKAVNTYGESTFSAAASGGRPSFHTFVFKDDLFGDPAPQTFVGGETGTMPAVARHLGWRFDGWAAEPNGAIVYRDEEAVTPTADMTLYAVWTNLDFDFDGDSDWTAVADGSWKSGAITDGQTTTLAKAVRGEGTLTFEWKASSEADYDILSFALDGDSKAEISGSTGWVAETYAVSGSAWHTLTWTYVKDESWKDGSDCVWVRNVMWVPKGAAIYTVTYAPGANGTGSQQTATKTQNVALTLKGAIFTRTGYTQTGWATSDGGAKTYDLGASYTANAAATLYPFGTANTYTVTLDRQSGIGGTASVSATYGSSMPSITVPTRTGYTFGGYYTSTGGSGTQYYTASGASARSWDKASATTLYAKWTVNAAATWTVTLEANGGTLNGSTQLPVEKGKAVGTLPKPEREGFAFLGWFTAAAGGTQVTATTKVTKDVTYYAHWQYRGAADDSTIVFETEEEYTTAGDGSFTLNLAEAIGSTSVPKVTVKGLPAGLKFDAKTLTISGKATKPGVYTVTVSATNATVKKPVTATFDIVVPNLSCDALPGLMPETDAYGVIRCGVAFDTEHVDCKPEDGWTVKAAGLPAGLKWDAKAGKIIGVPTKAGTFTVTFTATKGKDKQTATITLKTEALPAWAVGTFTGVATGEAGAAGAASMSVTAAGKISGKFATGGTNWTFAASSYAACDDDVCYAEVTAKAGRLARTFMIEVSPGESPDGTLVSTEALASIEDEGIDLHLHRNIWKDKATSAAAKALLQGMTGVYTASISAGDDYGAGYLSLTVSATGDVKASGKLADGTSVSSSVPLWWDDDGFVAWFAATPSAYKGGGVEVCVAIPQEHGTTTDGYCNWASRSPTATGEYGEGFVRESDIVCAYYDKLVKLNDYYETRRLETEAPALQYTFKETFIGDNNRKQTATDLEYAEAVDTLGQDGTTVSVNEKGAFTVAKATKPVQDKATKEWSYDGANDGALTLSFAQATGIFKGSYTFWYDYQSAYDETTGKETYSHTSKKVSFEGIWVQGTDLLEGFYLWDGTGYYEDPKTGKEKSYKYKESHGVRLAP